MRFCTHCGKQIADEAVICLNCGCETKCHPHTAVIEIHEDSVPPCATWARICGIVSFFVGWFALGITAIVLASVSKDDTNGMMCPAAKTGFVCGLISTILYSALFVIFISVYVALLI